MLVMALDIRKAIREEPKPLDFVLPGMLAGTVGALVSPGGAGKSILALQLSVLVTTGFDISGVARQVAYPKGKVVILAAEDPEAALAHRLHALGKHIPPDLVEPLARSLEIEPLVGKEADIMRDDWFKFVMTMATGKRILFLDTLRRFHGMDENDAASMAILIGRLEAIAAVTGCSIIFLHHSSKAAALQGQGDQQQASRGSSVLVDNIRWQFFLSGMSKVEAKDHEVDEVMRGFWVRGGVSKQNYGQPFAELWLRREGGGVLTPGHIDSLGSRAAKRAKGGKRGEA